MAPGKAAHHACVWWPHQIVVPGNASRRTVMSTVAASMLPAASSGGPPLACHRMSTQTTRPAGWQPVPQPSAN